MTDSYRHPLESTVSASYDSKPGTHALDDVDDAAIIRLVQPETAPTRESDRAYYCSECNSRVTIGTDGTEFGHRRGSHGRGRCSKRPADVDPTSPEDRT